MLKAMTAPYRHLGIKFMPTGGITAENVLKYLEIPEVIAAGGTWLGTAADVKAGAWDKIEQSVKDAINIIK
jgi:2-dehydro-3-deoxyphosphogluconate aldolase/(4S)-4-hydroxy-2-oxoglutarate aldolase